jgi:betaine reductase
MRKNIPQSAICNLKLLSGRGVKIVFKGKRVIVIGERDGVPGPAIANCVIAAGGQVVYTTTECFV